MHLIEPCCAPKHLRALRGKLGENGTVFWHGYGDLSLEELMRPMLARYSEVELIFVAPVLPDAGAEVLRYWMQKQWARADGRGKIDVIKHLTLISDLRAQSSPLASEWLIKNPFGTRMTLHNIQQNDTAILLPDIAFFGNINMRYGGHFTAVATKNTGLIAELKKNYLSLTNR